MGHVIHMTCVFGTDMTTSNTPGRQLTQSYWLCLPPPRAPFCLRLQWPLDQVSLTPTPRPPTHSPKCFQSAFSKWQICFCRSVLQIPQQPLLAIKRTSDLCYGMNVWPSKIVPFPSLFLFSTNPWSAHYTLGAAEVRTITTDIAGMLKEVNLKIFQGRMGFSRIF